MRCGTCRYGRRNRARAWPHSARWTGSDYSPSPRRQAFQLQVRIGREALGPLLMNMAAIVENAQAGKFDIEYGAHLGAEHLVDPLVLLQPMRCIFRVEPLLGHGVEAFLADAVRRQHDVEENARRRIAAGHFARHAQKFVAIRLVIEAERMPARLELAGIEPVGRGRACAPFRMQPRIALVPLHGDVDGAFDIGGIERIDHFAQQIRPRQLRVRRADLGRIIGPAMVALGEDGDRVHMRRLEGAHEILCIEVRADGRDMLGGMKVEMDLAITQWLVGRRHDYSLAPERVCEPAAN